MHDLGFLDGAVHVTTELYTGSLPKIKLYFAETDLTATGRGHERQHTLSLLYVIFYILLL